MSSRKKIILFLTVVAVLVVPFPTRVSSKTEIQFLRSSGVPVSGVKVYQSWQCYGYGGPATGGRDERTTDKNSVVRFPARIAYATVASRILGRLVSMAAPCGSSYGVEVRVEFTLQAPDRATFSGPAFSKLEPFATSGTYVDSAGRHYSPQVDGSKQWVLIAGDFRKAERIVITVE